MINMIKTGTLESSDCMIELKASAKREIEIESIVFEQFGDQIYEVLSTTLDEYKINGIHLRCIDKGALDYTIKARLKAALDLWGENNG
jgi:citrate lyase subunit gamma (acyl carrier protein)